MLLNLKNYKLAKIYEKDLDVLIKNVQGSIDSLAPYIRYKPAARILSTLHTELGLLKAYQQDCKKIIAAKGAVKDEDSHG